MYVLDEDRVLRIPNADESQMLARDALYREIEVGLPWRLPHILDHDTESGVPFTIEERLPGRSLDKVLPELRGDRREQALIAYADGATRVKDSTISRPWFGELFYDPSFQRTSWPEYLRDRAAAHVARAGARFAQDVPALETEMRAFDAAAEELPATDGALVHGDYFPGNVMIDDDLAITAVIDFGWSTVIGDPRLDLTCASVFLEVERPWCSPGDAEFVAQYLTELDPSLTEIFATYRTYCALHFSFVHNYGIPLYEWCVRALTEKRP